MRKQQTKQHILVSTIDAIEKHGINHLTTRLIAQEAGVNNAALHYYFGTKDELVDQALAMSLDHMVEDTFQMLQAEGSLEQRMRDVFLYLVEGVEKFPNLIRAHIQGSLMEGDTQSPFLRMFSTWIDGAVQGLQSEMNNDQQDRVRLAMHTAISGILMAGLMPEATGLPIEIQLRDPQGRERYIDYLISSLLSA